MLAKRRNRQPGHDGTPLPDTVNPDVFDAAKPLRFPPQSSASPSSLIRLGEATGADEPDDGNSTWEPGGWTSWKPCAAELELSTRTTTHDVDGALDRRDLTLCSDHVSSRRRWLRRAGRMGTRNPSWKSGSWMRCASIASESTGASCGDCRGQGSRRCGGRRQGSNHRRRNGDLGCRGHALYHAW